MLICLFKISLAIAVPDIPDFVETVVGHHDQIVHGLRGFKARAPQVPWLPVCTSVAW